MQLLQQAQKANLASFSQEMNKGLLAPFLLPAKKVRVFSMPFLILVRIFAAN